jgi:hypothetical protein
MLQRILQSEIMQLWNKQSWQKRLPWIGQRVSFVGYCKFVCLPHSYEPWMRSTATPVPASRSLLYTYFVARALKALVE